MSDRTVRFEARDVNLEIPLVLDEDLAGQEPAVSEDSESSKEQRRSPTFLPLLLEVGCEEIPARFLRDAERQLGERVKAALLEANLLGPSEIAIVIDSPEGALPPIEFTPLMDPKPQVATYSTPRRLVVHVPAVLAQQPDQLEEVQGPPVKVAIDAEGKYTRAAESFAQKNAAHVTDLTRTNTPKGEYLSLRKTIVGRPASEILPVILPQAILGLSFPKSMYWTAKSDPRFVRPLRWVLALFGEGKHATTVGFEIVGVKTGNYTFGHRLKGSKPLVVAGFKNYSKKLLQSHVEIDYKKRLKRVIEVRHELLRNPEFQTARDEWLADWIVNATEWPHPIVGDFDERFLHLPREILTTVMRDHQRYFAVERVASEGSATGSELQLAPHFVAVLNVDSDETGLIRQGHQRVLTARFRDAEFFWNADQKTPLRVRLPLLDKVTYQEKLGSYGDKVQYMRAVAEKLGDLLELRGGLKAGEVEFVLGAIDLCKCDLTTQMVQEFTELQGVVGGLYATAQGEPAEVAEAIYDHYLPLGAEGASPRSLIGAMVSLADKIDSVVAGFSIGNEPTGSSDPFALRRQANGIVKLLIDFNLPIQFAALAMCAIEARSLTPSGLLNRVVAFLLERLTFYLGSVGGCRYDTARAVIAAHYENAADALRRAQALEKVRDSADYRALAAAAKRTRNLLRKSASQEEYESGVLDESLLQEEAEVELYKAYETIFRLGSGEEAAAAPEGGVLARDYEALLTLTARLRPQIDKFFDKVLVMHSDPRIRKNRLLLLRSLDTQVFSRVADLSEIEGKVDASTSAV